MRCCKIDLANRGTQVYYRGVGLSAVGVLLFLTGLLELTGLAGFGAGGLAMGVIAISGAGAVVIGFAVMTAACCGLDLKACDWDAEARREDAPERSAGARLQCRACRTLNDESAAVCQECGEVI